MRSLLALAAAATFVIVTASCVRAGGLKTETLAAGGLVRAYQLYAPPNRDASTLVPLVLVLHGAGGSGAAMRRTTFREFERLADRDGFLVAYAEGVNRTWNDGRKSSAVDAAARGIDDVAFVSALIDHLIAAQQVDPHRVYVTGFSNGAGMTHRLACELADKIAAIAPVAGYFSEDFAPQCAPAKPLSVLLFANEADPIVPFRGGDVRLYAGSASRGRMISANDSIGLWAKREGCAAAPEVRREPDRDPADGTKVRREAFGGCRDGAEVTLYVVEGGGHTWPGGSQYLPSMFIGKASRDVNACRLIWEFFQRHPRE